MMTVKQQNNCTKKYSVYVFLCLLFVLIFTGTLYNIQSVFAQSTNTSANTDAIQDLQNKINERNKNIEQLNKEIQLYQSLVDKTSAQALSLQKYIQQLELNGKAIDADIKKTKAKIEATSLDINRLDLVIHQSADKIDQYKQIIAANIRQAYQKEDTNVIANFLAQKNLSDVLNQVDQIFQFNTTLNDVSDKLTTEKKLYEGNKQSEVEQKTNLVKLQSDLTDKKKVLDYNKSEQSKVLAETKDQQKTFQQIVQDKKTKEAQLEQDVFNYESQLKYTLNPSSIPVKGTHPLNWPVANVIITQLFGKTVASSRLYVSGSHNGVDFGAKIGTPVMALADGVVSGAGDTDITCPRASFGRWVLIKYKNGLASTYGHLSVIKAVAGQTVHTGDIIGYSGNTGYSTGPHVHISLYAANAVEVKTLPSKSCSGRVYTMPIAPTDGYLDPMLYFPSYNK